MSGPPALLREVIRCEACVEQPSPALLLEHSGLPARMRSWTFDTFRGDLDARDAVSWWVTGAATGQPQSLLLAGGNGRGKTGLAAAAVNVLCGIGIAVRFEVVRDMLDAIRRRIPTNQADAYRAGLRAAPVLILDDLSAEKGSEFVEETLLGIIDGRLRDGLPTLATTHSSPAQIEEMFGAATADRLREFETVAVNGDSMRGRG